MSTEGDCFEFSEFSMYEILYMGHQGLSYVVECMLDDAMRDPFDIIAEREEFFGKPIIFMGAHDM
jgi:hypothetical protein